MTKPCQIQVFMGDDEDYLQCVPHDWSQRLPDMPDLPGDLEAINEIAEQHRQEASSG